MPIEEFETTCPNCKKDFDVRSDDEQVTCPHCEATIKLTESPATETPRSTPVTAAKPMPAAKKPTKTPGKAPGPKQEFDSTDVEAKPRGFARLNFLKRLDRTPAAGAGLPLLDVEGIGPTFAKKLNAAGFATTEDLLAADAKAVAKKTGISYVELRKWQDMAELIRLPGIGPQYSEVLVRCDINSVAELARQEAEPLSDRINAFLASKKTTITAAKITPKRVKPWIAEAAKRAPPPVDVGAQALRKVRGKREPADEVRAVKPTKVDDKALAEEARHDAQRGFLSRFRRQRAAEEAKIVVVEFQEPATTPRRSLFSRTSDPDAARRKAEANEESRLAKQAQRDGKLAAKARIAAAKLQAADVSADRATAGAAKAAAKAQAKTEKLALKEQQKADALKAKEAAKAAKTKAAEAKAAQAKAAEASRVAALKPIAAAKPSKKPAADSTSRGIMESRERLSPGAADSAAPSKPILAFLARKPLEDVACAQCRHKFTVKADQRKATCPKCRSELLLVPDDGPAQKKVPNVPATVGKVDGKTAPAKTGKTVAPVAAQIDDKQVAAAAKAAAKAKAKAEKLKLKEAKKADKLAAKEAKFKAKTAAKAAKLKAKETAKAAELKLKEKQAAAKADAKPTAALTEKAGKGKVVAPSQAAKGKAAAAPVATVDDKQAAADAKAAAKAKAKAEKLKLKETKKAAKVAAKEAKLKAKQEAKVAKLAAKAQAKEADAKAEAKQADAKLDAKKGDAKADAAAKGKAQTATAKPGDETISPKALARLEKQRLKDDERRKQEFARREADRARLAGLTGAGLWEQAVSRPLNVPGQDGGVWEKSIEAQVAKASAGESRRERKQALSGKVRLVDGRSLFAKIPEDKPIREKPRLPDGKSPFIHLAEDEHKSTPPPRLPDGRSAFERLPEDEPADYDRLHVFGHKPGAEYTTKGGFHIVEEVVAVQAPKEMELGTARDRRASRRAAKTEEADKKRRLKEERQAKLSAAKEESRKMREERQTKPAEAARFAIFGRKDDEPKPKPGAVTPKPDVKPAKAADALKDAKPAKPVVKEGGRFSFLGLKRDVKDAKGKADATKTESMKTEPNKVESKKPESKADAKTTKAKASVGFFARFKGDGKAKAGAKPVKGAASKSAKGKPEADAKEAEKAKLAARAEKLKLKKKAKADKIAAKEAKAKAKSVAKAAKLKAKSDAKAAKSKATEDAKAAKMKAKNEAVAAQGKPGKADNKIVAKPANPGKSTKAAKKADAVDKSAGEGLLGRFRWPAKEPSTAEAKAAAKTDAKAEAKAKKDKAAVLQAKLDAKADAKRKAEKAKADTKKKAEAEKAAKIAAKEAARKAKLDATATKATAAEARQVKANAKADAEDARAKKEAKAQRLAALQSNKAAKAKLAATKAAAKAKARDAKALAKLQAAEAKAARKAATEAEAEAAAAAQAADETVEIRTIYVDADTGERIDQDEPAPPTPARAPVPTPAPAARPAPEPERRVTPPLTAATDAWEPNQTPQTGRPKAPPATTAPARAGTAVASRGVTGTPPVAARPVERRVARPLTYDQAKIDAALRTHGVAPPDKRVLGVWQPGEQPKK